MKTVSIGDTHGVAVGNVINEIIDRYDKFIFTGDYVDSFYIDNISMKENLLDIIELKKKYSDKIILLWGNHDIHYLLGSKYYSSGFRPGMQSDFHAIFDLHRKLFQLSFQVNNYLWTHAGINAKWFNQRFKPFIEKHENIPSVSALLNLAFDEGFNPIFDVGCLRGGGHEVGGPLWCDKAELYHYPFKGFNQIAGHNPVDEIEIIKNDNNEIVLIDMLDSCTAIDSSCFYYKEFIIS